MQIFLVKKLVKFSENIHFFTPALLIVFIKASFLPWSWQKLVIVFYRPAHLSEFNVPF